MLLLPAVVQLASGGCNRMLLIAPPPPSAENDKTIAVVVFAVVNGHLTLLACFFR